MMTRRRRGQRAIRHILTVGRTPEPAPAPAAAGADDPLGGACRHCLRTLSEADYAGDVMEVYERMRDNGWSPDDAATQLSRIVQAIRSTAEVYISLDRIEYAANGEQEIAIADAWRALQAFWKADGQSQDDL